MSLYDYRRAQELHRADEPFAGLIMAAIFQADTANVERLAVAFPEIHAECLARYHAGGGILPGEPGYAEVAAERRRLGLPPSKAASS